MAEKNNPEEPLYNNKETNEYIIPETCKDNEEPTQYSNPKPHQKNQKFNQNNIPEPSQNNIQGAYQVNFPGPGQNNNSNLFHNCFGEVIISEDLNNKKKCLKLIFCIIMIFIFIVEIILMINSIPSIRKTEPKEEDRGSLYIGTAAIYQVFIFPTLIILSIILISYTFIDVCFISKIIYNIILSLIIGYIMKGMFNEGSKEVDKFGIALEILNGILLVFSISYQITIFILIIKNNNRYAYLSNYQ